MSKLSAFAMAFSVVLLTLFVTLVYLMTKINPPEQVQGDLKPNGTSSKFDDTDYYFNPNEAVLPNDNQLRYGLEKVTGEYDTYSKIIAKSKSGRYNTEIPQLVAKNEIKENCTRTRISKIEPVIQPIEPVKDLRRSINEKEFLENKEYVHIAFLLKIKRLDEQPGIQIKLVSDNLNNQRSSTYESSGMETMFNSSSKISFQIDSANNSITAASIVMAENGTFIFNIFANAIDLIKENDIVSYKFGNDNTGNETNIDNSHKNDTTNNKIPTYYGNDTTFISDITQSNYQTEIESAINITTPPNMYTYNLINNNFADVNFTVAQNNINETFAPDFFANKNTTNTDEIPQETSESTYREENETVTRKIENESVSVTNT